MSFTEIFLLAVCLSLDAFAVALAAGASGQARDRRAEFRIWFHFGLFQFLMPIVGWLAAFSIEDSIQSIDHWLACALLWFVGFRMMFSTVERRHRDPETGDVTKGMSLVALSVATSIDALAIGITLAFLGEKIIWPSGVIGLTTALISFGGVRLGRELGARFGAWMNRVGGTILLLIGIRIVVAHLGGE